MQSENNYNHTSSAFQYSNKYEQWKELQNNPLVKQFSLKSYSEVVAAEHNIENKKAKLDIKSKDPNVQAKFKMYENALETLDMISLQMVNFTADLMFESELSSSKLEIEDAEIIDDSKEHEPTTKKDQTKMEVVHNASKEKTAVVDAETDIKAKEEQQPIVVLPAFQIPDKEVKAIMHDVIKQGETKENLVEWLKEMVNSEMFEEKSRIQNVLSRGEGDERYIKYVEQFFNNPAKEEPEKPEKETKSEVTEIEVPNEKISFNKMKGVVKKAVKDNVDEKVIRKYIDNMIDKKLIKGGSKSITSEKERKDWLTNVINGVKNARKLEVENEKVAKENLEKETIRKPIFDKKIEEAEDNTPSKELLAACQTAEYELKAGNRDKAVGVIKHYLGEYGGEAQGTFNDLDIHRLLNWIDSDLFHHRNPTDLLHNIPLSLTDVIKEVQKQVKIEGKSRKAIQSLIYSQVEGVKMREMKSEDEVIRNKKEFEKWFEANCGFVFRDEEMESGLKSQEKFEQNFEKTIREAKQEHSSVLSLVREYKKEISKFNIQLDLKSALKIIVSKLEALNPGLKKAYDDFKAKSEKSPKALPPASAESKENGSSEKDDSRTGSSDTKELSDTDSNCAISEKNPELWNKTKKLRNIEGLTNFILTHKEESSIDLFGLARELILSGQITDAKTEFEKNKPSVPWDAQFVANWFRTGPAKLLESYDLITAKNKVEFKEAIQKYITRNPSFGQEEILNKLSELVHMDTVVRSKYAGKLTKQKNFRMLLQKLYEETLEENHVHTT